MKKVMVFGAFDLLHPGHIDFFRQAKRYGDFLIAVVARDASIAKIKGHTPMFSERRRIGAVRGVKFVDMALLGDKKDRYALILKMKPDVICLGYDQKQDVNELRKRLNAAGLKTKIVRLKPFKQDIYKSSRLKETTL